MPGIVMADVAEEVVENGLNGTSATSQEKLVENKSPTNNLSPQNPQSAHADIVNDGVVDTSIEQLYENVCDMESSDQSPSRHSFGSDGEESRIDSELRDLVGGEMREVEIIKEEVEKPEGDFHSDSSSKRESSSGGRKSGKKEKTHSPTSKSTSSRPIKKASGSETSLKSGSKGKTNSEIHSFSKKDEKNLRNQGPVVSLVKKPRKIPLGGQKIQNRAKRLENAESGLENPDMGPLLLKQARDLLSSGENPQKALELAIRAAKSYELCAEGRPNLELVMCLHITAAIYCSLGQYNDAIPLLEQSIGIPAINEGLDHALAKFAGQMQLGDTYAMLGQVENSIICYTSGLEVQRQVLGETDPRVGETCRYLAEAHVQALQFEEAERLCQMALNIHKENGTPASLEEAADRRLMGLICEIKGDNEAALQHLVLASLTMVSNGQETEVASVDCSIGDSYLSLSRYDEAVFAYQKALTAFKTIKGENHPAVGSVFVRLAELYNKTGNIRESKSYCENALRIYEKPIPGLPPEEIASGLTNVSAILESMNELEQALRLLQKALMIYNEAPGQQSSIGGIEAQMGVIYYMLGNYSESYNSLSNAISKLRASGEKKSAFFGIALNQMGLACVQRYAINEAIELFEEARLILEQEYGPYHPDTLGVYSNLAATYDAVGRLDDAIEMLEYVVGMREEKLGTANPEVEDEKRRLAELLKEAGRVRNRKARSLETLLDANSHTTKNGGIKV